MKMTVKAKGFIERVGYFMLLMAVILLLLFLANLRSRLYYHGPDYGFLFWMFLFAAVTGVGLLQLKRRAAILLFVPGVLSALILVYASIAKAAYVLIPWALVNIGFVVALLGIPALLLRHWDELRW